MKILYLGFTNPSHPWSVQMYQALRAVIDKRFQVEEFDVSKPASAQFRDVDVVVDQGGMGSREDLIDAAAQGGVAGLIRDRIRTL